jgi:membrane-associated phospholipid phosphatase
MEIKFKKGNQDVKTNLNEKVIFNCSKLNRYLFIVPLLLIVLIVLFLVYYNCLNISGYIEIQKNYFFQINSYLGQYPNVEYNLTQLGDASIFLSFLILFILYAPKIWESLLSTLLISLIFSKVLKNLFLVPRPAEALCNYNFIIVGKRLPGFSSLPSGHSITFFAILTVLLFSFMPKKILHKFLWVFTLLTLGIFIVFSRVGVGAHYPFDVVIGIIVGYLSGLIGIFISRKYKIWSWINHKKYYSFFMVLIIICSISLIIKIINENFIVYYLALISLFVSLYKFVYVYFKK